MDAVVEILKGLDYSPLYVSLKTGIVATIFSFFLGLFAARRVIKAGPKVKAIADGILDTLEEKGLWKPEGARNRSTASESGRTSSDADTSASVSSSVQQKTSVWYPAVRTIWHQSCTDLGWLYHSSDRDRISADVQKCKSGIRTDRCESDPCGKNTWYAGI